MAEHTEHKIVCYAEGDRCHGCDHYWGRAPECKYKGREASEVETLRARVAELRDALVAVEKYGLATPTGPHAEAECDRVQQIIDAALQRGENDE